MAYFGGKLRAFAGYWVSPPPIEPPDLELEPQAEQLAGGTQPPVWHTSSGNRITWVEAWYAVPAYKQPTLS